MPGEIKPTLICCNIGSIAQPNLTWFGSLEVLIQKVGSNWQFVTKVCGCLVFIDLLTL